VAAFSFSETATGVRDVDLLLSAAMKIVACCVLYSWLELIATLVWLNERKPPRQLACLTSTNLYRDEHPQKDNVFAFNKRTLAKPSRTHASCGSTLHTMHFRPDDIPVADLEAPSRSQTSTEMILFKMLDQT
jgi:hypothetical protein